MTDRIPLDHLTSDQYDELCGELERLRADARQCAAQQWPQRLARAEAATDAELRRQLADAISALGHAETELAEKRATITRAHTRLDEIADFATRLDTSDTVPYHDTVDSIRATLPARPADGTTRAGAEPHVYLSTGCLHGDHAYCQSMTGLNGAKRPGSCKQCGARCICGCHSDTKGN